MTIAAAGHSSFVIREPIAPSGTADPDKRTRRWTETRWLVDSLIFAHGPEFDQPRSLIYSAPAGFEALAEFQGINPRIRKFADMHREYAAAARRREAKARAFLEQERRVAARESFFIAAQLWAALGGRGSRSTTCTASTRSG